MQIEVGTGVHTLSADVYHADPCPAPSLSASVAKVLIEKTPAHAWLEHPRLNPQRTEDNDPKFDAGKAVHSLFLEGIDILGWVDAKDWRTKAAQEARDEHRAAGRIPVTAPQHERLLGLLPSLQARVARLDDAPAPFTDGSPEQTLIWQEENGVWCRARLDWLRHDYSVIDDLKTVASASPGMDFGDFGRAVWTIGHDVQEAFYRRGLRKLAGIDPRFRFIAIELDGPGISCCSLGAAWRAIGEAKVERAIALWGDCLARNDWPGYPSSAVELEPPAHEIARWEAITAEEACL